MANDQNFDVTTLERPLAGAGARIASSMDFLHDDDVPLLSMVREAADLQYEADTLRTSAQSMERELRAELEAHGISEAEIPADVAVCLSNLQRCISTLTAPASLPPDQLRDRVKSARTIMRGVSGSISAAEAKENEEKELQREDAQGNKKSAAAKAPLPRAHGWDHRVRHALGIEDEDGNRHHHEGFHGMVDEAIVAAVAVGHKATTAIGLNVSFMGHIAKGDRVGMRNDAIALGRGVARTTGSQTVGHFVTNVVNTEVTVVEKSQTTADLVTKGHWNVLGDAVARNVDGAVDGAANLFGASKFSSELKKHLGALIHDKGADWEHLVSANGQRTFDINGDGKIDLNELTTVLRNNKVTFEKLDLNHDGQVSGYELTSAMGKIRDKNHAKLPGHK